MRIKAFSGAIIKVDKMKRSITIDGRESTRPIVGLMLRTTKTAQEPLR